MLDGVEGSDLERLDEDLGADVEPPRVQRRFHDRRQPNLIPPIAAGSRDPVVFAFVGWVWRLYDRRGGLRNAVLDEVGRILFPAFPELLRPHPAHVEGCPFRRRPDRRVGGCHCPPSGAEFTKRRSDGMESVIRVLCVLVACCDWITMEIMDPKGGYLSVARLAELARLPVYLVPPRDTEEPWRRRYQMSCVERALRILRDGLFVNYTEQHREEKLDGRKRCTGPAKRKLSVSLFKKIGFFAHVMERREYLKKKRQRLLDQQFEAGIGTDLALTSLLHKMQTTVKPRVPQQSPSLPGPNPIRLSDTRGLQVPEELIDAVHEEHPDWLFPAVYAEAARRANAPPPGGSGEPSDEG